MIKECQTMNNQSKNINSGKILYIRLDWNKHKHTRVNIQSRKPKIIFFSTDHTNLWPVRMRAMRMRKCFAIWEQEILLNVLYALFPVVGVFRGFLIWFSPEKLSESNLIWCEWDSKLQFVYMFVLPFFSVNNGNDLVPFHSVLRLPSVA